MIYIVDIKNGMFKKYTEDLSRHFFQRRHTDVKRCSTSLVIREMQIKTIMRCHLTPVRMAVMKKSTNN